MYQVMTPDGRMQFMANDPAPTPHHVPAEHAAMKWLSYGGIGVAGLALAPVIAKTFGDPITQIAGSNALDMCGSGLATGWAGSISGLLSGIPLIGAGIAGGGLMTVGVAAALMVGGMWLANHVDKQTPEGKFQWGKVIRWASMATSVLVSLPAILPAISMGLNFLSFWLQPGVSDTALLNVGSTIGKLGTSSAFSGTSMALGGASMGLVHTLTCALPMGLGAYLLGKQSQNAPKDPPTLHLPELRNHQGRVMQPQPLQLAAG